MKSNRWFTITLCSFVLCAFMVGCRDSVIPKTAIIVAEDDNIVVYLNQEDKSEIPKKSLWIRYKETNEEKRLLVTHPNARGDWQQFTQSVKIPIDSIQTIGRVTIVFSYKDEPVILLVEGCIDHRNIDSFIISDTSEYAIGLPTSSGLVGIAQEEGLLIMESYDYYKGGGRYSRIEAFDLNGNKIDSMAPMINPQYNIPVYSEDEMGRKVGSTKPKEVVEQEYKSVIRELKRGTSLRRTARLCGCSPTTVGKVKKIMGI